MKASLIALLGCCAISATAFALPDDPGSTPPRSAVMDDPGVNPPHYALRDDPGVNPPRFAVMDDPGSNPPHLRFTMIRASIRRTLP